jgi:uncharacterized protein YecE (DUF72 family)
MKPFGNGARGLHFCAVLSIDNWPVSLFVGTSGYSHDEWKGIFYPEKISQKKMLDFYSRKFSTVEINYTFRQLPTRKVVEAWAQQVPASFRFALKAQKAITHIKKLQNAEQETDDFLSVAAVLEERQGPILFQMSPSFKKDVSRLETFLKHIAGRAKSAFEFRHASWLDDEVADCLRAYSAVLCVADGDDLPATELVRTADWGYVRLRDDNYTDERLREWIQRIRSHKWDETYVFFMHEDTGIGPKLATRFIELAGA